ncbi:uncharacterized protein SCHCODRAFT_02632485 [Schizophyllum commune H4-8]|uniref:uncharacterized protein n=1 Tax=Schizophyllum commune (strain H4-8 / FGSC 9210) TaxID=578458 RepID=UPI00215E9232|nr:uncharacterized protein SCHCODRAFT_02632485 [Schizophyllum commune H4-8]KAI5890650.1 hypothetical protein SCHCODRAFT_02632485 [Schizophyllum commune H4-8]
MVLSSFKEYVPSTSMTVVGGCGVCACLLTIHAPVGEGSDHEASEEISASPDEL